jgi:hypothetical protein
MVMFPCLSGFRFGQVKIMKNPLWQPLSQRSSGGFVPQRLLQPSQCGELPLAEAREALGLGVVRACRICSGFPISLPLSHSFLESYSGLRRRHRRLRGLLFTVRA